jgi:predicted RNA-binding Zn-ribbon protein involved in translation (DUF1610 family)
MNSDLFLIISEKDHYCFLSDFENALLIKGGRGDLDAAWSTFREWLEYFGFKYGKVTVAVPPHNTSQNCANCGEKVSKSLSTRTHVCPDCGYVEDRDVNAALNILQKGLSTVGHTGSKAWGELPSTLVGYVLPRQGDSGN